MATTRILHEGEDRMAGDVARMESANCVVLNMTNSKFKIQFGILCMRVNMKFRFMCE